MAITYQPRTGLPQWSAGADPFGRAQVDDAFAKLESFMARGEQGPLNQLPAPAAPTTATAAVGGTLAPATYGYRITALSPAAGSFPAGETTPSAEVTRVVPAGTNTNTVTLNWTAVPGATGYRIYGRTPGAELLLATVGAVVTWTDTGAGAPAGVLPATNTTAGRPAPGIRNRTYWATDDRAGRYSYDDGTNWNDLGPSPVAGPVAGATALIVAHAAAATSDAVLTARGKTGQSGDLLKIQDPTAATDYLRVSSSGALFAQAGATVRPGAVGTVGLVVNGLSGQTADLQQWQVNGVTVGSVAASGAQTVAPNATGAVGLTVNQPTGATGDAQQWQVAGAVKANLTAAGKLALTGGLDVSGSPTGYLDELRFPNPASAAAGTGSAITTLYGGSPRHFVDHRGTGNAGDWQWRNGTGAASTRMALDASGNLTAFGNLTIGTTAAGAGQISLAGGSVSGRVAYQDNTALYMGAMDVARPLVIRSVGADALTLNNQAGQNLATFAGVTGVNALLYATAAGVGKFEVDATGGIEAAGDNHYLGRAALGAAGARLKILTSVAANGVTVNAEDQGGTLRMLQLNNGGLVVDANLNVNLGQPNPSTTATTGFPYMPGMFGAPTGAVPAFTIYSGGVPFTYDFNNHKLWVRDSGVWRGVVLT